MPRWLLPAWLGCVLLSATDVAGAQQRADTPFGPVEVTVGAGISSDYVYRGTTLSARRPNASSTIDIAFGRFYVGSEINSVRLPTEPVAEIGFRGGYNREFGALELDLGAVYYWYPRERLAGVPTNSDYWELQSNAIYNVSDRFRLTGEFSWSPNISKTGAWSKYAEIGFEHELPNRFLPAGVDAEFSAGVARYWFGEIAPEFGGFRLPAYTYWHAGIEFVFEAFRFDLRYHDTNLSKENCLVFTGDPGATPGGVVNGLTNPDGLRSNWCGATVVATLRVEFGPK